VLELDKRIKEIAERLTSASNSFCSLDKQFISNQKAAMQVARSSHSSLPNEGVCNCYYSSYYLLFMLARAFMFLGGHGSITAFSSPNAFPPFVTSGFLTRGFGTIIDLIKKDKERYTYFRKRYV
jgi:hypothetical protein